MVSWLASTLVAYIASGVPGLIAQSSPKPPPGRFTIAAPSDRVEIDGSKNPELVPEWYVWETFFRELQKTGTVPSELNLTTNETRTLQMEVEQYNNVAIDCQKQIENLRPLVGVASNSEVNQKQRAIQLECRHRTLDLRERLLSEVRPDTAVAVLSWIENLKSGIEISVPKRELVHFRQPR